VFCTLSAYTA